MISTEDWKVEQPTIKTLARNPLVLLDQLNWPRRMTCPTTTIAPRPTFKEQGFRVLHSSVRVRRLFPSMARR